MVVRATRVGGVSVFLEMAEGGTRYHAPILILPGLFQSEACWRGITSMLAHRGWDVYVLPRLTTDDSSTDGAQDWSAAIASARSVAQGLGQKLVVLGADIGASLALALGEHAPVLALGLFGPTTPARIGKRLVACAGFFGRRRLRKGSSQVAPPDSLARLLVSPTHAAREPGGLVQDLLGGVSFEQPEAHPPAFVFVPDGDPLVSDTDALEFARGDASRTSPTRLRGRWWPATGWEPVADAVHRDLILTLSDRVVDFPEEILAD
jgi:hypothetical protein